MKRTTLLKTMLLLCALIAGSGTVWADVVILDENFENGAPKNWTADSKGGGSTSGASAIYTGTDAHGEGTGKAQGSAWKLGTNKSPYGSVTTCALTDLSGSATLTFWARGKKDASPVIEISGTNCTITGDGESTTTSGSVANGTIAGADYKQFTVNISNASAATKITFRHAGPSNAGSYIYIDDIKITMAAEKTDPTITFSNGSVRVGKTLDLSTLFTSNSTGDVTYSITDGGTYATIDGNVLTGVEEGSVTVKASQEATGVYNEMSVTATITIQAALTLNGIAVTTAPTKTTYLEDEVFDATGMVITATYSDGSTDDVTARCTWTPNGALTTSDTEVTISYTENATTKTATQEITVNAYTQPTSVTATFNNEFLGVTAGQRISEETTKDVDRVSFVFNKISGSNWPQGDAGVIRMYQGTTLTIKAPTGYAITNIAFTANGDWKSGMTANVGTYDDTQDGDKKTYWTGCASSVTFSPGGTHRIATVVVTLAKSATISIAAACTDGTSFYGTYYTDAAYVMPEGVIGQTVTVANNTLTVTDAFKAGDVVPAKTALLLKAEAAGDKVIALTTGGTAPESNMLKGTLTADEQTEGESCLFYRLTMHNGETIGFWWGAAEGAAFKPGANKAYLAVPNGTAVTSRGFSFGDTTGIGAVDNNVKDNGQKAVFNLNGQRVAQPRKGLYIVNGKKVVVR